MGSIASPALPATSGALGVEPARVALVFAAFTLPAVFGLPAVLVVAGPRSYGLLFLLSGVLTLVASAMAVTALSVGAPSECRAAL